MSNVTSLITVKKNLQFHENITIFNKNVDMLLDRYCELLTSMVISEETSKLFLTAYENMDEAIDIMKSQSGLTKDQLSIINSEYTRYILVKDSINAAMLVCNKI